MRVKSIFSILLLLLLPVAMAGQVREYEVNDHGKRAIRTEGDEEKELLYPDVEEGLLPLCL